MGESRYGSTILDFVTILSSVVTFTPRPLYLHGNHPWYSLNKSLGGLQNRYGRYGEEKILAVQYVASRYTESVSNEEDAKMK
jgi:hypothetical protein